MIFDVQPAYSTFSHSSFFVLFLIIISDSFCLQSLKLAARRISCAGIGNWDADESFLSVYEFEY